VTAAPGSGTALRPEPGEPGHAAAAAEPVAGAPSTAGQRFLRRLLAQRFVVAMLALLVLFTFLALAAPWVSPYDPNVPDISKRLAGPSAEHWLGNDELGRDMLSRLIHGTRISLYAAVQAVALAFVLGVPIGLVSGFVGGWVDTVLMRLNDALMSFPALILAIAIVGLLGPSLRNAMIAIGIVYAPRLARVVRGATLAVREEIYVEAARATGCTQLRIVRRHVLPNILSPLVVQTTLSMGLAILAEAALSFLGLGVQPPHASWGAILGRSFAYIHQAPINVLTPGLAVLLMVLAFNIVGDGLRDAFGRERRTGE
jgi:peptide/nickel transport system permease protein